MSISSDKFCSKCGKNIAGISNGCIGCGLEFHPGCAKIYLSSKTAKDCCLSNLSIAPNSQNLSQSVASRIRPNIMSSPIRNRDSSSSSQASNLNLENTLARLIALHEETNASISAFSQRQENTNDEFRHLLAKIPSIDAAVSEHAARLAHLESENQTLRAEIASLKNPSHVAREIPSRTNGEVIFSGMPSRDDVSPMQLIKNIFIALGISDLASHILSIRKLPARTTAAIGDQASNLKVSFIVSLTSISVRDILLTKKRLKRELKWSEIFEGCSDASKNFNIFVNELLTASTYKLFRRIKAKAQVTGHKFVWSRDGLIYARRAEGQPRILINSEDDLTCID